MGERKEYKDEIDEIIEKRKAEAKQEMTVLYLIRNRCLRFMLLIITIGVVVPFAVQFFPIDTPWEKTASMWNSYVSIILGIIATLCSLLSIYLAFYAQNQTVISNNHTIDDFNSIRKEIKEMAIKVEDTNVMVRTATRLTDKEVFPGFEAKVSNEILSEDTETSMISESQYDFQNEHISETIAKMEEI